MMGTSNGHSPKLNRLVTGMLSLQSCNQQDPTGGDIAMYGSDLSSFLMLHSQQGLLWVPRDEAHSVGVEAYLEVRGSAEAQCRVSFLK